MNGSGVGLTDPKLEKITTLSVGRSFFGLVIVLSVIMQAIISRRVKE